MPTVTDVKNKVVELATNYPNAIYRKGYNNPSCSYVSGNVTDGPEEQGCIVGQALRLLNIEIEDTGLYAASLLEDLLSDGSIETSPTEAKDIHLVHNVQKGQDKKMTWGKALEKAMEQVHS